MQQSIVLFFSLLMSGLTTNAQSIFYQAYLTNDLNRWTEGINVLERTYEQAQDDQTLLQLAKATYGVVGSCLAKRDMEAAANWVDKAEFYTESFLKKHKDHAEAKALLAGVYGLKIGLKPMRGMTLGPKSGRLLAQALAQDPTCALAHYVSGMSAYNTPETWGGSIANAKQHFQDAKLYFEENEDTDHWLYISTLAWLGQSQFKLSEYTAAVATFTYALEQEPSYNWVKLQLLPSAQSAINESNR